MTSSPDFAAPNPDPLYTSEQAAVAFNMKPRTWRALFDSRAVPMVRIGRRLYVRRSDAVAYILANIVPAKPQDGRA